MSLIDQISAAITSDDDDTDEQSMRLAEVYAEASTAGKALLDEAFICLCGWQLKTLIEDRPYLVGDDA